MKTKNKKQNEICRFVLSGVQYSDYQQCQSLKVGTSLKLVWEPSNKFDSNAIRVECGGIKIGYVPKGEYQDMLHVYREQRIKLTTTLTAYNKNNPTWQMLTVACSAAKLLDSETDNQPSF